MSDDLQTKYEELLENYETSKERVIYLEANTCITIERLIKENAELKKDLEYKQDLIDGFCANDERT